MQLTGSHAAQCGMNVVQTWHVLSYDNKIEPAEHDVQYVELP